MTLSTFAVVIGVLSCLSYVFLSGLIIAGLSKYDHRDPENAEHRVLQVIDATTLTVVILWLIFYVIMCVVSVLLIVGVKKKRPGFMAPWIILSAIDIIFSIVYFFMRGFQRQSSEIILSLVYIAISCMVWYPIYTLWIVMRNENGSGTQNRSRNLQEPLANVMPNYKSEKDMIDVGWIKPSKM